MNRNRSGFEDLLRFSRTIPFNQKEPVSIRVDDYSLLRTVDIRVSNGVIYAKVIK